MLTDEQRVLNYIESHTNCPLIFVKVQFKADNMFLPITMIDSYENLPIEHKILTILRLSQGCNSNKISFLDEFPAPSAFRNSVETDCGRRRSVLDVWRHMKFFEPDLSIFPVMRGFYELVMNSGVNISEIVCSTVNRRVFFFRSEGRVVWYNELDEFGMNLYDWEKVGESLGL